MLELLATENDEAELHVGEWQCPLCGIWSSVGCAHMNTEATDLNSGLDLSEVEVAA